MKICSFSPFGYEGSLVSVDVDLRRGIPAVDIVGLADGSVRESRERMRRAILNSGLEFPPERVLISLSPADLKKEGAGFDLPVALGVLAAQQEEEASPEKVLVMGELELGGRVRPVRGVYAAVLRAKNEGICNVICHPLNAEELKGIDGIKVIPVENLKDAWEKVKNPDVFKDIKVSQAVSHDDGIRFHDERDYDREINDDAEFDAAKSRAIEIAVAGKHGVFLTGAPGCGKTFYLQMLLPAITPELTDEETLSVRRIWSLAGLDSPNHNYKIPPFRMPHQTASLEGMCGGGTRCLPGEISLAHNGRLFLDEGAEFRSVVLQMLRVPLYSKHITLSRAGRNTVFPANFQIAMAANSCPCGNLGSKGRVCLCSVKSVENYQKKMEPVTSRIDVSDFIDLGDSGKKVTVKEMRDRIAKAYAIQRERGVFNADLTPEQMAKYCVMDDDSRNWLMKEVMDKDIADRERQKLLKVALTVANMDGRKEICLSDLKEARSFTSPIFEREGRFVLTEEERKDLYKVFGSESESFDDALSAALKEAGGKDVNKNEGKKKERERDGGMSL